MRRRLFRLGFLGRIEGLCHLLALFEICFLAFVGQVLAEALVGGHVLQNFAIELKRGTFQQSVLDRAALDLVRSSHRLRVVIFLTQFVETVSQVTRDIRQPAQFIVFF